MGQFFDTVCCIDETKFNSYVSDEEEEYKDYKSKEIPKNKIYNNHNYSNNNIEKNINSNQIKNYEIKKLNLQKIESKKIDYNPLNEIQFKNNDNHNFVRTLSGLFNFGEKIFHTIAQQATRLTRSILRIGEHNFVRVRYMAKFYQFKLDKLINFIDDDALSGIKVNAWRAEDWTKIKEGCTHIYELCKNVEKHLAVKPGKFKEVKANYEKAFSEINVKMSDESTKHNTHDLYKLRVGGTLSDLGYDRANVVAMFRQLEELGEIVGMTAMKEINAALKKATLYVKTETTRLQALQKAKPNDATLKAEMDKLTAYNLRYSYLSNCINTYVMITDQLTTDLYKISKAFETSIIPKYVR